MFDLAHGRKPVPLLNTRFHEANPAFSPDGKWLAFTSNESGRPELYVQAFRSGDTPGVVGERHLVSREGALAVRWRRDGKELFYLGFDGRVQAVTVRLSPETRVRPRDTAVYYQHRGASCHSLRSWLRCVARRQRFVIGESARSPVPCSDQNWEALLPHSRPSEFRR